MRLAIVMSFLLFSVSITEGSPRYTLYVSKPAHTLYVFKHKNGIFNKVEEYKISVGKNSGNKATEGDKRTPEGLYKIKKIKRSLGKGYKFWLNYPNNKDKESGKTGSGIQIHGTGGTIGQNITNGCITLKIKDIAALRKYVELNTPVLISEYDYSVKNGSRKNGKVEIIDAVFSSKKISTGKPLRIKVIVRNNWPGPDFPGLFIAIKGVSGYFGYKENHGISGRIYSEVDKESGAVFIKIKFKRGKQNTDNTLDMVIIPEEVQGKMVILDIVPMINELRDLKNSRQYSIAALR